MHYFQLAKGMAEYRAGRFEDAADWLARSRDAFARLVPADRLGRDRMNFVECLATANSFLCVEAAAGEAAGVGTWTRHHARGHVARFT